VARNLLVCNDGGTELLTTIGAADDSMVLTSMGRKRADSLVAGVQAEVTLPGVDSDGDVLVKSYFGGAQWNQVQVAFETGPTGVSNEDLDLRVDVQGAGPAWEVSVQFATDGSGNSITPTASEVETLLNSDPAVATILEASLPGSGASDVVAVALTPLTGGISSGSWVKFEGKPPVCCQIHRVEVSP